MILFCDEAFARRLFSRKLICGKPSLGLFETNQDSESARSSSIPFEGFNEHYWLSESVCLWIDDGTCPEDKLRPGRRGGRPVVGGRPVATTRRRRPASGRVMRPCVPATGWTAATASQPEPLLFARHAFMLIRTSYPMAITTCFL